MLNYILWIGYCPFYCSNVKVEQQSWKAWNFLLRSFWPVVLKYNKYNTPRLTWPLFVENRGAEEVFSTVKMIATFRCEKKNSCVILLVNYFWIKWQFSFLYSWKMQMILPFQVKKTLTLFIFLKWWIFWLDLGI